MPLKRLGRADGSDTPPTAARWLARRAREGPCHLRYMLRPPSTSMVRPLK
jgi:hypothetical protein